MAIPTKKKGPDEERVELFPEGVYDAIVVNATDGKSKSSGREMLTLGLLIQHPQDPAKEKELKHYVTYFKYDDAGNILTDDDGDPVQSFGCKAFIDALVDTSVDGENGAEPTALIGRRCLVDVEWEKEEWRGKWRTRERVRYLNRCEGGPIVPDGERVPAASAAADDEDELPF